MITKKDVEEAFNWRIAAIRRKPLYYRDRNGEYWSTSHSYAESFERLRDDLIALAVDDGSFVEVRIGGTDECSIGKLIPLDEVEKAVLNRVGYSGSTWPRNYIMAAFEEIRNPPKTCPHCGQEVKGEKT